jgi:hypothetical protein
MAKSKKEYEIMKLYFVTLGNYDDYLDPHVAIFTDEVKANRYTKRLNKDSKTNYFKVDLVNIHVNGLVLKETLKN